MGHNIRRRLRITNDELLQYVIDSGIINPTDIKNQLEMKKRQEYLNAHNHQIWQATDGKWNTYLDDDSERGYSRKHRKSKEAIEDVIIDYYKAKEENPTIKEVYQRWMTERLEYEEISLQSYNRYCNDFKRFFSDDLDITNKKMREVSSTELIAFIKTSIKKHSLTAKAYSGLRTIIRGLFIYGKEHNYTSLSMSEFFGDLNLPRSIFKKKIINKEHEIFFEDEIPLITEFLKQSSNIIDLGLLLQFQTGLRIGELTGLKFKDRSGKIIHIQRTEIEYKDPATDRYVREVREWPKSDSGNRHLIVTDKAIETIDMIKQLNPDGTFMFEGENGNRIRSAAFQRRLSRVCSKLGIAHRPPHKIRKTYGTTLLDADVDESLVAEQMGHADISTTKKHYYFSNKNKDKREKQISNAISY